MKVTDPLLVTSFRNTKCRIEEFLHLVNITSKQWNKYIQTGKLKVSPTTYKKLTILAKDSPYKYTLLKIIDAQRNKHG